MRECNEYHGDYSDPYNDQPEIQSIPLVCKDARWSECVTRCLKPIAEVMCEVVDGDYQGSALVITRTHDNQFQLYEWSWGSCPGCDGWESEPTAKVHDEIRKNIQTMDAETLCDYLIKIHHEQDREDYYGPYGIQKWATAELIAKIGAFR